MTLGREPLKKFGIGDGPELVHIVKEVSDVVTWVCGQRQWNWQTILFSHMSNVRMDLSDFKFCKECFGIDKNGVLRQEASR